MKDPLQTEITHYEVLGVERGATPADIESAFRAGLMKRANMQKLLAAKQALQQPGERALLDLFHYNPDILARLSPNPMQDPASLQAEQRGRTAAAWEKQLKANFPDASIAHCLALLWYWWAVHEEAQGGKGETEQLWQQAIAYWAMVVASKEFWESGGISAELGKDLAGRVVERFRNHLLDLGQKHGGNRYHELELALTTEVKTAKEIGGAGLRTAKGTIACGPLLLQRMGVLENIRQQIENALSRNPANERLKSLQAVLSPLHAISVLLGQNKAQEALEAIARLPDVQRESEEARALRGRALFLHGKQQASLGNVEEALDTWAQAFTQPQPSPAELPPCTNCGRKAKERLADGNFWCGWCGKAFLPDEYAKKPKVRKPVTPFEQDLQAEIISTCQAAAAKLQQRQREKAVAILRKALGLVSDEKLQLTLAEILTLQGIETLNDAQRRVESEKKGATKEIMAAIEHGVADLKEAAKLGSKRAAENIAAAEGMLEQARDGYLDIPQEAARLMAQANQLASKGNLNEAITLMTRAVASAGSRGAKSVKKVLAQMLNARAISSVNAVMQKLNRARAEHEAGMQKRLDTFWRKESPGSGWLTILFFLAFGGWPVAASICGKYKEPKWVCWVAYGTCVLALIIFGLVWLVETMSQYIPTFTAYGVDNRPNCALCKSKASYTFNLPGKGEKSLCSSHADKLRAIVEAPPPLDSLHVGLLVMAEKDLEAAASNDSSLPNVSENLTQVRDLVGRYRRSYPELMNSLPGAGRR